MIAKGLPPHGGPRLGYLYDKPAKRYTIDPVTGPIFRECYEMYRDGKSMHALVLHLRDRDVRSLLGNPMSESALRNYLNSGFAAGLIVLNKPESFFSEERMDELGITTDERPAFLPGSWDPIISEDLWLSYRERRRVQALKPKRSRNPRQHLSGHLRCAGCGKRMIYRLERSRWVCCSQLTKDGASCPVHVSVSNSEATEFVKEWLRSLAGEYGESFDALVSERMKSQDASANRDVVEGQLLTEERRRENLVRAVSTGAFEAADVSDEMRLIKKGNGAPKACSRGPEVPRRPGPGSHGELRAPATELGRDRPLHDERATGASSARRLRLPVPQPPTHDRSVRLGRRAKRPTRRTTRPGLQPRPDMHEVPGVETPRCLHGLRSASEDEGAMQGLHGRLPP